MEVWFQNEAWPCFGGTDQGQMHDTREKWETPKPGPQKDIQSPDLVLKRKVHRGSGLERVVFRGNLPQWPLSIRGKGQTVGLGQPARAGRIDGTGTC